MNAQRWEVLTLVGNYYENVWSEDGEPLTFDTYAEAEAELSDHLEACEEAHHEASGSNAAADETN